MDQDFPSKSLPPPLTPNKICKNLEYQTSEMSSNSASTDSIEKCTDQEQESQTIEYLRCENATPCSEELPANASAMQCKIPEDETKIKVFEYQDKSEASQQELSVLQEKTRSTPTPPRSSPTRPMLEPCRSQWTSKLIAPRRARSRDPPHQPRPPPCTPGPSEDKIEMEDKEH